MPNSTPNSEQPSTRQIAYNPAESSAEYKLLYLQELVADKRLKQLLSF